MSWTEAVCLCDQAVADAFSEALIDAGALSVSVEDADAGSAAEKAIFGEPGSPAGRVWERNRIVALLDGQADAAALIAAAAAACGIAPPPHERRAVAEEDWVRQTQAQFHPIRVSERLWIVPTWHAIPDPAATVVRLDPGLAFGTGSHPTTRLCLRWLDSVPLAGRSVLDYGCGSGILAIAAARLGAGPVHATDIDAQAGVATRDNARANLAAVEFIDVEHTGALRADIVVANILTNPLKVLAGVLVGHMVPGGRLTLSGILEDQEAEVIAAYAPLIKLARFALEDGWTCLTGTLSP